MTHANVITVEQTNMWIKDIYIYIQTINFEVTELRCVSGQGVDWHQMVYLMLAR